MSDSVGTTEFKAILSVLANSRKLYVSYIVRATSASLEGGVDMLAYTTEREITDLDKRHVTDNNLALVAFAVLVRLLVR